MNTVSRGELAISPQDATAAFLVAAVVALVADALLQSGLDAVSVSGYGSGPPWWVTANLVERGRWVVLAGLLWWLGPMAIARLVGHRAGADRDAGAAREAWRLVGVAVIAVPLLWIVATWLVSAVRFTALGSWSTDGRAFLSAGYYRAIVLGYAPWLVGGAGVLAARWHL